MDVEKFVSILKEKRAKAEIKDARSEIGTAFNDGVETMFNYAISAMYDYMTKEEIA